jgi:hypothetical protein
MEVNIRTNYSTQRSRLSSREEQASEGLDYWTIQSGRYVLMFQRNILLSPSTLKIEAVCVSETLAPKYHKTLEKLYIVID